MKKSILILIFSLSLFSIFGNPFFNSGFGNSPNLPAKDSAVEGTETESEESNDSYEKTGETSTNLNLEAVNQEVSQKSGPNPVMVGKTNEKLTIFQGDLREKIASFFRNWKTAEGSAKSTIFWGIIGVAFLYGILHAAGPGHRKTIVFSLYIARKSPWYEPLLTGFLLALLHGGCAIFLMLIFKGISGSIAANTNAYAIYMEGFSYLLIIVVSLFLIVKETIEFVIFSKTEKAIAKTKTQNQSDIQESSENQKVNLAKNQTENQFEKGNSSFRDLVPFLISGLYPCPGAILVLVLSFTLDILGLGIAAVSFMSLGMAIPIIIVAYFAWFGRKGLFMALKNRENVIKKVSFAVEIFGYTLLILFSLYIAMPFFASL